MAIQILSDYNAWVAAAYVPATDDDGNVIDGKVDLRTTAEAYVVYGTLTTGMDVLDESTAEEWLTRLRAWEIVDGPMVRVPDENGTMVPHPVTMDDLRPFFGTRTNNFPKETTAKFTKRVGTAVLEKAARRRP